MMALARRQVGIEDALDALIDFLPQITELPPERFDPELFRRLLLLEALTGSAPATRLRFRKLAFELMAFHLDRSAMLQRLRHRPLGYPADFVMLEQIDEGFTGSPGVGGAWEAFVQRQPSLRALRGRSAVLAGALGKLVSERPLPVRVLGVQCGAGHDLRAALGAIGEEAARAVTLQLLEGEPLAAARAREVLSGVPGVQVRRRGSAPGGSVGSFHERFDLVWVPAVVACLDDVAAVRLLARSWQRTAPGGRALVGQVAPAAGLRAFFAWGANWSPLVRSEAQLRRLCTQAGIPAAAVRFVAASVGMSYCRLERPESG